jgi:putative transcriptional regulator
MLKQSLAALPASALVLAVIGTALHAASSRAADHRPASQPTFQSVAGQLLVATELITDPRFEHTVIYMARHDARGAMGVVVNRKLGDVPLARVLEDAGQPFDTVSGPIAVHYGGPVEPARGVVLHTADYAGDGTVRVGDQMALTLDPAILRALAAGAGPRRSLFVLGYAGWGANQLEQELARGAWVLVPADESLVFGDDHGEKWERAMERRGIRL